MKTLAKVALASALFICGANAGDLLSKATGGAIGDTGVDVKILDVAQMHNIKGGYRAVEIRLSDMEHGVYADISLNEKQKNTICAMGQSDCSLNENRWGQYINALEFYFDANDENIYRPMFTVKKEVRVDNLGTRYNLFTYYVGAYNTQDKTFHKINSSLILNNNTLILELRNSFQSNLERSLGKQNYLSKILANHERT